MSTADDNHGSPYDQGASPWGIPAPSGPPPSGPGGHLPAFEPTIMLPPRETMAEPTPPQPESQPQPAQPFFLAPPPQGPLRPLPPEPPFRSDDGRRRRTLVISGVAVLAVLGVAGAVAMIGGGSNKDPTHDLASKKTASQISASGASGASGPTGLAIKPDGGDLSPATTGGGEVPGDGGTSDTGAGTSAPVAGTGLTTTTTAGSVKTGAAATSASARGSAPSHTTAPSTGPNTTTPPPATTTTTTVAAPPPVTRPSGDCTTLDLPANQMPVITQNSNTANAVLQLQCLLKKSMLGIKPLVIDGQWGPATQSAVTTFQGCTKASTVQATPGGKQPYPTLAVNGVVDAKVWADLYFWDNQVFNRVLYYCNGTRPQS